jgi:hypothetical protein
MDANNNINIFRLIHFDNLEETLRNGMYCRNSGHIIPNFVNIGDTTLIKQRETFIVPVNPPNGNLGDYILFYFAGHSPMLLNIKTGARGIQKREQKISYISFVKSMELLRTVLSGASQMVMPKTT